MRGRFITFEGIDGSGKSTQLTATASALRASGIDVLETREPGGTALGESLRTILLGRTMSPLTETLLMFAARVEHVDEVIVPALGTGHWVLCDRFTDASYAYQSGGRGIPAEWIANLETWAHPTLQPDLTVVIDLDPKQAAMRRARVRTPDRFEAEDVAFFERVREVYAARARAEPNRILLIDGARPSAEILERIVERVKPWRA
ncbi:MAG: dTMP kinase [Betaproteobacteria bacterium]|jgi:dTMP kinase|nr:MAG: dTMP kinase [Betaproteobacteria bacterium]